MHFEVFRLRDLHHHETAVLLKGRLGLGLRLFGMNGKSAIICIVEVHRYFILRLSSLKGEGYDLREPKAA